MTMCVARLGAREGSEEGTCGALSGLRYVDTSNRRRLLLLLLLLRRRRRKKSSKDERG